MRDAPLAAMASDWSGVVRRALEEAIRRLFPTPRFSQYPPDLTLPEGLSI